MKDREDHPFWLEIYTEERIPAATFCLGSDGLLYEGKLRFRPLNADLLAALEPLAEQSLDSLRIHPDGIGAPTR